MKEPTSSAVGASKVGWTAMPSGEETKPSGVASCVGCDFLPVKTSQMPILAESIRRGDGRERTRGGRGRGRWSADKKLTSIIVREFDFRSSALARCGVLWLRLTWSKFSPCATSQPNHPHYRHVMSTATNGVGASNRDILPEERLKQISKSSRALIPTEASAIDNIK